MKTDQEWEESYRTFSEVLDKLDQPTLQRLSFLFECHPSYVGEVQKHHHIERLWSTFRDWRKGTDRASRLLEALAVLRCP